MSKGISNICRVCSSPAEYSLSKPIPRYLHENANEHLQWEKPINVLLEEATCLKVSPDDNLPQHICALCIFYLKHAITFREQTISNTMNLKALQMIRERLKKYDILKEKSIEEDKESLLVTPEDLNTTEEHEIDMNLLTNNCKQIQDKVCKQLINNIASGLITAEDVNKQMQNLSTINGKGSGISIPLRNAMNSKNFDRHLEKEDSGSESGDESKSNLTSESVEEEEPTICSKDILSYKEKCFEEDDIMDFDEIRGIVLFQRVENFKERKCPACSHRFMFTDSYNAHTELCFEYAFLIFIEDINRLLKVRRKKAISPHEYIRRMIFRFRKMCEWLNANTDEDLPNISDEKSKTRFDSYTKSSESSKNNEENNSDGVNLDKYNSIINTNNELNADHLRADNTTNKIDFSITNLVEKCKKPKPNPSTPINMNNNILYEIERSLSQNSMNQHSHTESAVCSPNTHLKRPIPILGSKAMSTSVSIITSNANEHQANSSDVAKTDDNIDRLTFLQKLQRACQTPPSLQLPKDDQQNVTTTATISVRKDLMQKMVSETGTNELPITPMALKFVARCNACGILFQSLAALEVHNAAHHNSNSQ